MDIVGNLMSFEGAGFPLSPMQKKLRPVAAEEVLVRNLYTTICGSDLHTYCGTRKEACPSVLGHEIVGRVISIGDGYTGFDVEGTGIKPGDIVTWSIFASNPDSYLSLCGMPQKGDGLFKYGHALITEQDAFHGGLAEYCYLKKGTAILKIPVDMPLPVAATINCAISTSAGALRLSGNLRNRHVLITGAGLLGLTSAAMCREAGAASVSLADVNGMRLEAAKHFGASGVINMSSTIAGGIPIEKNIDIAIDMSGAPDAIEYGLSRLSTGGTAVWVGTVFKTRHIEVDAEAIIRRLITIKGLHNYNFEDFKYALSFMAANWRKYPYEEVVTAEFSMQNAEAAFKYALGYKPLRVGVRID